MILDPLYVYPLLGAFFMALSCSLIGAFLFTSKRLLVGETLSHAAYPGALLGALISLDYGVILLVAALSAAIGKLVLERMIPKVAPDNALCFVLASFFGLGVLIASYMQAEAPLAYKQSLIYLFGQVATMTRVHVVLYAGLTALLLLFVALFYKELKTYQFDKNFAINVTPSWLPFLLSTVTVMAIVISLRSVGVVLLSAMLIAPATAARAFSKKLSGMLLGALFFGSLSACFGSYYSLKFDLPTGPLMALVGVGLALVSLIIAPRRGVLVRYGHRIYFVIKCRAENILKALYKKEEVNFSFAYFLLRFSGFINAKGLTLKGDRKALQVIRLHRLFELYLTEQVGLDKAHVHFIAEDAEHYITPDIEREIDQELNFPESDPHKQPIPKRPR